MAVPSNDFTSWLLRQRHRDDPTGDLARGVGVDDNWPPEENLRVRIEHVGEDAEEALRTAWAEWRRFLEETEIAFSDWVLTQTHREDPVGDLAHVAAKLENWPKGADWERVHKFAEGSSRIHYPGAIDIAWFAYREDLRAKR